MKKQILTLTLMFTASLVANAQYSSGDAQLKNEHLAFATSAETMPTCLNYAQSTGRTAQPYTANTSNVTFNANPSAKQTPAAYAAPASELQIARGFKGFVEPSYSPNCLLVVVLDLNITPILNLIRFLFLPMYASTSRIKVSHLLSE